MNNKEQFSIRLTVLLMLCFSLLITTGCNKRQEESQREPLSEVEETTLEKLSVQTIFGDSDIEYCFNDEKCHFVIRLNIYDEGWTSIDGLAFDTSIYNSFKLINGSVEQEPFAQQASEYGITIGYDNYSYTMNQPITIDTEIVTVVKQYYQEPIKDINQGKIILGYFAIAENRDVAMATIENVSSPDLKVEDVQLYMLTIDF